MKRKIVLDKIDSSDDSEDENNLMVPEAYNEPEYDLSIGNYRKPAS